MRAEWNVRRPRLTAVVRLSILRPVSAPGKAECERSASLASKYRRHNRSVQGQRRRWESNPLEPGCSRSPGRLAPASGKECPRQELNLVHDLRRVVCASVTLRGRVCKGSPPPGNRTRPYGFEDRRAPDTLARIGWKSALARSRTWSTTFGGSRAIPSHSKGNKRGSAGVQGFEPCRRVLEARCSPRSTPLFFDKRQLTAPAHAMASEGSWARNLAQLSMRAPCAA